MFKNWLIFILTFFEIFLHIVKPILNVNLCLKLVSLYYISKISVSKIYIKSYGFLGLLIWPCIKSYYIVSLISSHFLLMLNYKKKLKMLFKIKLRRFRN